MILLHNINKMLELFVLTKSIRNMRQGKEIETSGQLNESLIVPPS